MSLYSTVPRLFQSLWCAVSARNPGALCHVLWSARLSVSRSICSVASYPPCLCIHGDQWSPPDRGPGGQRGGGGGYMIRCILRSCILPLTYRITDDSDRKWREIITLNYVLLKTWIYKLRIILFGYIRLSCFHRSVLLKHSSSLTGHPVQ